MDKNLSTVVLSKYFNTIRQSNDNILQEHKKCKNEINCINNTYKSEFLGFTKTEIQESIKKNDSLNGSSKTNENASLSKYFTNKQNPTNFENVKSTFKGFTFEEIIESKDNVQNMVNCHKIYTIPKQFENEKYLKKELNESHNCKTEIILKKEDDNNDFAPTLCLSQPDMLDAKEKVYISNFVPPKSPHNLVEESLYENPWGLLVGTIFLNKTHCFCARPHIFKFLQDYPNPFSVIDSSPTDFEKYFLNIGLKKKRSVQIWRMSYDFIYKNWRNVKDLYGIGKYGEDAFKMFILGDFDVQPQDRFLKIYKEWYKKVLLKETT